MGDILLVYSLIGFVAMWFRKRRVKTLLIWAGAFMTLSFLIFVAAGFINPSNMIELEKGPRGNYPEVELSFDPTDGSGQWVRRSVIKDEVRFTFQFGKRYKWATFRYGIKESTGGIGSRSSVICRNTLLVMLLPGSMAR